MKMIKDDTTFKYDVIFGGISDSLPNIKKATRKHTCDICKVNIYKGDRIIRNGILFMCVKCMVVFLSKEERRAQLVKESITNCISYVKKNKKDWLKEQMIDRL